MKDKDASAHGKRPGPKGAQKTRQAAPAPIEACFQAVFESSRDAIGVSQAGVHEFVNPAYLELFGFLPGTSLAGKPVLDLIAPGCRDQIREHILRRLRGEPVLSTYETRGLRADGSEFDMEVNVSRYQEHGEDHTLAILRDVTARKRGEQKIAERDAMLRQIMDTASVAIFLVDKSGRIFHANRRMTEMFGCPMEELLGSEYVDHVHPAERETGRRKMLALLASEIPAVDLERLYRRRDGTQFWGHLAGRRYHDPQGTDLGLVGVITDITARRQGEEQARASENRMRSIIELLPIGMHMYHLEADGRLVFSGANSAADRILGVDNSGFVGKTIEEAFPPLKSTEVPQRYREAAAFGKSWRTEQIEYDEGAIRGAFEVHAFQTAPDAMAAAFEEITDRKRSELALQMSEAKYRRLYNATPVLLHSIDRNGVVVEVNDHWLQTLGYERGEVLGRKVTDFYTEASRSYAELVVQPAFFRGDPARDIAYQFVKKSGEVVDVLISATAERDDTGNIVRSQSVITDVTDRRRAETALRQSEERFRRLVEHAPIALSIIDKAGRIGYINEKHTEITGYTIEDVPTLEAWWGLVYPKPEAAQRARAAWGGIVQRLFSGEAVKPVERTFVCKDGSSKDVELRLALTGEKILAVFIDITERKRTEAALRDSEDRYRQLFEAESDAIFLIDNENGAILMANNSAQAMYGYGGEELLAMKNTDLSAEPSSTRRVTEETPIVNENAITIPLRFHRKKDGTVFPVEITGRFFNYQDRPVYLAAVRDITERRRAEAALRENQARLDLALQSAHMGVWRWEIGEDRRYFDELTCQLLGIEPATFAGTAAEFLRAVHPEDRELVKAAFARTIEWNLSYEPTYRVLWPDGSSHVLTARGRLVLDDKGRPARVNGILWDITDQSILEQERIKMQKLESVGTLAGGIAHDFNNLLQGVFGYISLARINCDKKEKSLALLEQAEKALHQSVNLTSQLLTFSKGGKPVKKVVDLRPLIENSVALSLSGSRVTSEIVVDEDLQLVEADEGQIGQVIQNIVLNADQAMPLGGTIRVTLRNIAAPAIVPSAGLQGDLVEITIRDQGAGIPAEHLPRIFDPYFTTKEKGSGLGLASSYSIVRNHGGLVRVQSEVGSGTTFHIYLPASRAHRKEADHPEVPAARRPGRILVMDDEEMIRDLAGEMLRSLGHEAVVAEHGEAALEAYRAARAAGQPFDVVILDLTIRGGMGGVETVRKLVEFDPDVQAVVSSGYSEDAALATYRELGFRAVLDKPYSLVKLQDILNSLMS